MQEGVVDEREAEPAVSNWYLCRDGQQHGPLTDRELSLFAESGKFKPGDLLWTEGLDTWKPADAIFGEAPSREVGQSGEAGETSIVAPSHQNDFPDPGETVFLASAPEAEAPEVVNGEHVNALVQALKGEAAPPKLSPKERVVAELKTFSGLCGYLWVVFALLALHAWVGETRYGVTFAFFVLTTINAFWLAKLIPLVETFAPLGSLKRKPLAYSILYKTIAFGTLLFAAYGLETILLSWLGGDRLDSGFTALAGDIVGTLALWLIFCFALLPYFAFKELERAVGADMIGKLLFGVR